MLNAHDFHGESCEWEIPMRPEVTLKKTFDCSDRIFDCSIRVHWCIFNAAY